MGTPQMMTTPGPMTPLNQQNAQWSPMPPTPAAAAAAPAPALAAPAATTFTCPGACGVNVTSTDRFCVQCGFNLSTYPGPIPTPVPTTARIIHTPTPPAPQTEQSPAAKVVKLRLPSYTPAPPPIPVPFFSRLEPIDGPVLFRQTGIPEVDDQIRAQILVTREAALAAERAKYDAEVQIAAAIHAEQQRQDRIQAVTMIRSQVDTAMKLPGVSAITGLQAVITAAEQFVATVAAAGVSVGNDASQNVKPDIVALKGEVDSRTAAETARKEQERKEAAAILTLQSAARGMQARRYAARLRVERAVELAEREALRVVLVAKTIEEVEGSLDNCGTLPNWREAAANALDVVAGKFEPELVAALPGWNTRFTRMCAEEDAVQRIQACYRGYLGRKIARVLRAAAEAERARLEGERQARVAAATQGVIECLGMPAVESIALLTEAINAAKELAESEAPELEPKVSDWFDQLTARIQENKSAIEVARMEGCIAAVNTALAHPDPQESLELLRGAVEDAEISCLPTDVSISCTDLLAEWQAELAERELQAFRTVIIAARLLPIESNDAVEMFAEVIEHTEDLLRTALDSQHGDGFVISEAELLEWRADLSSRTAAMEEAARAERISEIQQLGATALLTPIGNVRDLGHVLSAVEDFEASAVFTAVVDLNLWRAEHSVRTRCREAVKLDNDINVFIERNPTSELDGLETSPLQVVAKTGLDLASAVQQLAPMANTWRELLEALELPVPDATETVLEAAHINPASSSDSEDMVPTETVPESTILPTSADADAVFDTDTGAGAEQAAADKIEPSADTTDEDATAGGDGTDYDDDSDEDETIGAETFVVGETPPPTPTPAPVATDASPAESSAQESAAPTTTDAPSTPSTPPIPAYDRGYALRCAIISVQAVVQLAWPSLQMALGVLDKLVATRMTPKCTSCGFEMPAGTNFCESCGTAVQQEVSAAAEDGDDEPPPRPPPIQSAGGGASSTVADDGSGSPAWLHASIEREMSETLLGNVGLDSGTFLIRESSTQPGTHSLSVRDSGSLIKHYRLEHNKQGVSVKGSTHIFPKLQDLVAFYKEPVSDGDRLSCRLTNACPKSASLMPIECLHCKSILQPENKFCQGCGKSRSDIHKPKPDLWELPRKDIVLMAKIGAGNFGEVRLGRLKGKIDVAVKTSKKNKMTNASFLEEATKMKELQHDNLVRLYGVCTMDDPIFIVLEYLSGGCLLEFLRTRRGKNATLQQLACMLKDVCDGMAFMEDVHWVHGDLAARNMLMGANKVVKICDFGHSVKTDEENASVWVSQQLPVRWTAPEFYRTRTCSPRSDVWSFGVVIFEVLSRGEEPYTGYAENKKVMKMLTEGYRMPRHKKVPKYFYDMMVDCWQPVDGDRPTFRQISKIFRAIAGMDGLKETKASLANTAQQLAPYRLNGPTYRILTAQECPP
jgi:hypothetical protein